MMSMLHNYVYGDEASTSTGSQQSGTLNTGMAQMALKHTDQVDLTQPDDLSDVTLVVEGRKLFTSRVILASASPVWRRMFASDFKEKEAKEIPLPGKSFDGIQEMLLCITPAVQKPVTGSNVGRLLPLVDEYQMQKLKQDCEDCYLHYTTSAEGRPTPDELVGRMILAQKYNLTDLLDVCAQLVADIPLAQLEKCNNYGEIESETLIRVLKERVSLLEQSDNYTWLKQQNEYLSLKLHQVKDKWDNIVRMLRNGTDRRNVAVNSCPHHKRICHQCGECVRTWLANLKKAAGLE